MAKGLARIAFEKHTHTQLDRKFHVGPSKCLACLRIDKLRDLAISQAERDYWILQKENHLNFVYKERIALNIRELQAEEDSRVLHLITDGWDSLKTSVPTYTRSSKAEKAQMRRFLEPQMRTFLAPSEFFHGGARIQELVKCDLVVQEDPLQPLEGRVSVVLKVEEVLVYQTA